MASIPPLSRDIAGLATILATSGVIHLLRPEVYEGIVPHVLPHKRLLVHASGVAEIACAAGLLHPATRRVAGWGSAALLVGVFPANVQMSVDHGRRAATARRRPVAGDLRRHPRPPPTAVADGPDGAARRRAVTAAAVSTLAWRPVTAADLAALHHLAACCLERDGGPAPPRGRDDAAALLPQRAGHHRHRRDRRRRRGGLGLPSTAPGTGRPPGWCTPPRAAGPRTRAVRVLPEHSGGSLLRVAVETSSPEWEEMVAELGLVRTFAEHVMRHDLLDVPRVRRPEGLTSERWTPGRHRCSTRPTAAPSPTGRASPTPRWRSGSPTSRRRRGSAASSSRVVLDADGRAGRVRQPPRRLGRPGRRRPAVAGPRARGAPRRAVAADPAQGGLPGGVADGERRQPGPRPLPPARLPRRGPARPLRGDRALTPAVPVPGAGTGATSLSLRGCPPHHPTEPSRGHAHVVPVPANPSREPGGRRGPEPPAPRPGRLHPPGEPRHLHLAAARPEGAAPRRADRARGDGRHRLAGAALPRAAAPRALRGLRALDRVRRRHLPPQGPQGRRLPPRADARGDVHPRRQGPVQLVQGPPPVDLPDPDEVPRRGPPRAPGSCAGASSS